MTAMEVGHRGLFSWLREAEGSLGATPFLEGSLMAFRANLMDPESFDVTSNADDAQIATAIAEQGYRTAQHPDAIFHDTTPRALAPVGINGCAVAGDSFACYEGKNT